MKMHSSLAPAALLAITLASAGAPVARAADASGERNGIAIAGRLSTLGPGAEVFVPLGRRVNLRGGFNMFTLDFTDTQEDIDYNVKARLRTGAALLDWHPAGSGFRFSLGAMYNGNELKGTGRPREKTTIGDVDFTPAQIGTLSASVEFSKAAGYVGFGFGNATSPGSRLTVLFDIGVMFYNAPELRLSADGEYSGNPTFQTELEKERQKIQDDFIKVARIYPVVSLGLGFRF